MSEETTTSKYSQVDEYGFKRDPEEFDAEAYEEFMSDYLGTLVRRNQRWEKEKMMKDPKKSQKMKRFIRKGIPGKYRSDVWMALSGASEMQRAQPEKSYLNMLSQPPPSDNVLAEQIHTDIPRTFPSNIYFAKEDPKSLQQPLFNVLLAFSYANPTVGYCQGLNYVAGLLLIVTKDEEKAYWLLRALIEKLLPDYYIADIPGLITDVRVLAEFVGEKVPNVYKHVEKFQMPWELIASKWFMCLFSDVLPVETSLRLWDCLFYDGSKVLIRAAVTVLKIHEEEILSCQDFSSLAKKIQSIANTDKTLKCHDFIQLMYKVSDPLKSKELLKKRNRIGYFVKIELKKQQEKRNQRKSQEAANN